MKIFIKEMKQRNGCYQKKSLYKENFNNQNFVKNDSNNNSLNKSHNEIDII